MAHGKFLESNLQSIFQKRAAGGHVAVQSAGWSADVERWESDEDSEDSEDEIEGDEAAGTVSEETLLRLMA